MMSSSNGCINFAGELKCTAKKYQESNPALSDDKIQEIKNRCIDRANKGFMYMDYQFHIEVDNYSIAPQTEQFHIRFDGVKDLLERELGLRVQIRQKEAGDHQLNFHKTPRISGRDITIVQFWSHITWD